MKGVMRFLRNLIRIKTIMSMIRKIEITISVVLSDNISEQIMTRDKCQ